MELLSPAGSPPCVPAAVQNGADAIYLGTDTFNARQNAVGFSQEELQKALDYCRLRGIKTFLTMNTLLTDRELTEACDQLRFAYRNGLSAVIVQDLGVLRMVKSAAPELPIHASTQMSVHNLDGVKAAAELGCSRVVLARELSASQIEYICAHSPIEIEVFVHGALCMSYSGQCYLSAVIGGRSANRGLCAGPCRLKNGFGTAADEHLLSLKELSLARHLPQLEKMGVACVKIEGRMRRPEYVAVVTRILRQCIDEKRPPSDSDIRKLETVFSRQGFTDGYYKNELGPDMFGMRDPKPDKNAEKLYSAARATYESGERPRVGVRFVCVLQPGRPARLRAQDEDGHVADVTGLIPNPAFDHAIPTAAIETQLYKTGGTFYYCDGAIARVAGDLSLPLSAFNAMRREALDQITEERKKPLKRPEGDFKVGARLLPQRGEPLLTISLSRAAQLTTQLLDLAPTLYYLPLEEIVAHQDKVRQIQRGGGSVAAALPRIIHDYEWEVVNAQLREARAVGVEEALVGNLGQIEPVRHHGFGVRGDIGLNLMNSMALKEVKVMGLLSAALSFELNMAQVRDISLYMDSELVVYGRVPVMVTENCVIKRRYGRCSCENLTHLTDRTGEIFPILRESGCRNLILNAHKIFLADKQRDYKSLGLWATRLQFTTENPLECVQVVGRYMGRDRYAPNSFTRGLYYRSVE